MLDSGAGAVRMKRIAAAAAVALALGATALAEPETLVQPDDISRSVIIQDLSQQGDRVAGVITNLSDKPVRDVRLQIVFSWLWADEHRQGTDDPSFVATEVIHDEIAPRGQTSFGYSYPAANTMRQDGTFLVDAKIVGFRLSETRRVPE